MTLTGNLDYSTGILFRGYGRGVGYSILDGGRYDGLSAHYGNDFPSVGFAIKIDHLLDALTYQLS
jgi:ATP phosphoribosyltransferase regulatory subunit